MHQHMRLSHKEALKKLIEGNRNFINAKVNERDISIEKRQDTLVHH